MLTLVFLIVFFCVTDIIYVDESGINRYYQRGYGRSKRGARIHGTKHGKRLRRTNIIAGLWYGLFGKKYVAMQTYSHSTNSAFFEDWFEFELLAAIPEYSLIILDNASFYRKTQLYEIAARYGVVVLFLPPYSPDLNPIEPSWANFKRWLVDNLKLFPNVDWAAIFYFAN
jgi:transposase